MQSRCLFINNKCILLTTNGMQISNIVKGIHAFKTDFLFFLLKVANIRCFILIADEIFHNIIRKQPRTKEVRRCLILLHPVKHSSMFTRIFMILFIYSVAYTAKFGNAFVNVRYCLRKEKHKQKLLTDSTRKRHKGEDIASFV